MDAPPRRPGSILMDAAAWLDRHAQDAGATTRRFGVMDRVLLWSAGTGSYHGP